MSSSITSSEVFLIPSKEHWCACHHGISKLKWDVHFSDDLSNLENLLVADREDYGEKGYLRGRKCFKTTCCDREITLGYSYNDLHAHHPNKHVVFISEDYINYNELCLFVSEDRKALFEYVRMWLMF